MFETYTLEDVSEFTEIKGFVHIGAHYGEEKERYKNYPVLWVEGHPDYYAKLEENIAWDPYQTCYNAVLSNVDDEETFFYVTADEWASSILKPTRHEEFFPHAKTVSKFKVKTKRFDTLIAEEKLDMLKYNVLVLDIQGGEYKALEGFGDYLWNFPVIVTEFFLVDLYEDIPLLSDLCNLLDDYDLKHPKEHFPLVGDAMFVRKK